MDVYHAYTYGTAFWYFLRGITRLLSPETVITWFRPPYQMVPHNDLELYETRSEAWCLMALTASLLLISGAMPLRSLLLNMPASDTDSGAHKYAKGIVAITIFHHITTGLQAASHFFSPNHYNTAMAVGVYGSGGLAALGIWTLMFGMDPSTVSAGNVRRKKI